MVSMVNSARFWGVLVAPIVAPESKYDRKDYGFARAEKSDELGEAIFQ